MKKFKATFKTNRMCPALPTPSSSTWGHFSFAEEVGWGGLLIPSTPVALCRGLHTDQHAQPLVPPSPICCFCLSWFLPCSSEERHFMMTTHLTLNSFLFHTTPDFCLLLQIFLFYFMLFLLLWTHFPALITSHIWVEVFLSVSRRQTLIL